MRQTLLFMGIALLVAIPFSLRVAQAQGPVGDGIQAGLQAYQQAEQQRRAAVAQQVDQNEFLRYRPRWYVVEEPVPYDLRGYRYLPWNTSYSIFSAYPYPAPPRIRQPVGQREIQTGPNRWESFPIYAEDRERPAVAPARSGPRDF
jgi:hypothetical protein